MLKKQIIPALAKLSETHLTFRKIEGAKVTWYFKGIAHTFANVEFTDGRKVEVIFDALNRVCSAAEYANTTITTEQKAAKEQRALAIKNHKDGSPCTEDTDEICICELPF